MLYDDGSEILTLPNGQVVSRDAGSEVFVNDPAPAPPGWSAYTTDAAEQAKMGQAYPANGQGWDTNAAILGVSRLIDTASRAVATLKGSSPATYAGQNGNTYANGRTAATATGAGSMLPLLAIAAVAFLALK